MVTEIYLITYNNIFDTNGVIVWVFCLGMHSQTSEVN